VRKTLKIAGVVIFSATYLVAVSLFFGKFLPTNSYFYFDEPTERTSFFSFPSFFAAEANLPAEIAYHPVVTSVSPGTSFHFQEFSAILRINDIILTNSFVSYSFRFVNFPVRLRKADLLFPFHGFW
jgi:hypothetical protein